MPTQEFLEKLKTSKHPHLYLHGQELPNDLTKQVQQPSLLDGMRVARVSLWISSVNACSPIHYDLPNVLLCQLQGRKRVYLYPPEMHDAMRPRGATFPALTAKERMAQTKRSQLPDASALVADLFPGDAIFMPPGWFHEVETIEDGRGESDSIGCVSVGFNWPPVGDAISLLAPMKEFTGYRILTAGEVLARHMGEAKARALAGYEYDAPVF